jgi:parallel beta-helix repeat protein
MYCILYRNLYIAFVLLGIVTPNMAMADMPGTRAHCTVILEDNELYQNNLSGIRIRGSMPVSIKTCKIYSNGRAGIITDRQAQVVVSGCDVFQNGRAGINIEEARYIAIENNRIYENDLGGIRVWRSGEKEGGALEVKIADNSIYGNVKAGIRSMPPPKMNIDLAVVGNDIYKNGQAGVRVENNTMLTAWGNRIYENGRAGIISSESVAPPMLDIYQNRLSFNGTSGIHVVNGITGRVGIRNNWVFNNHLSGIVCGIWSKPNIKLLNIVIINNTVVSNGSSGPQQSNMVVSNGNTDQGSGIRNDSKGKAVIMNNIVAYNYVSGIVTRRCREFSYNLLFANGDVGNCCDDPHSAPYWVERFQFAGCPERGKGDLIADPLFVDPDNYNFCIQDESPAIDAGKDRHIYNDTSFPPSRGTKRNDIGATGGPYAARAPR